MKEHEDRRVILDQVWITKYALTSGVIIARNVEHCIDISEKMISLRDRYNTCYHKPDWHLTESEAAARVVDLAGKQITALDKRRDNLVKILQNAKKGKIKISE